MSLDLEDGPELDLEGAPSRGGGSAPPATISAEWKLTGGSEAAIADAGTAMPTNMAGKQLILVITPTGNNADLDAVATSDVGLLNEDGSAVGTLPADMPTEIPFDMKAGMLAGIATITLTIDGTPYTFTFHCFQYTGTLRAVNSGGTSTTGITVNGVNIGDAGAGHTTMAAAHAAMTSGETVVATEAFSDTTQWSITKDIVIDVADSARHDGTQAANGYRATSSGATQHQANSTSFICRNVRFVCTTAGVGSAFEMRSKAGGANGLMERCVFRKEGIQFQPVAGIANANNTSCNFTLRNCIAYSSGTNDGIVAGTFTGTVNNVLVMTCENCTSYHIGVAAAGSGFLRSQTTGSCTMILKNCVSLGTWTNTYSGTFDASSSNNVGTTGGATPPGSDPLTTTAAAYFKNVTGGSEDAHCVSRAVLDDFPGADLSANFTKDIDGTVRADWYAGADWIAP